MKINARQLNLYAVTDRSWLKPGETLVSVAEELLKAGVTCVQLREKHMSDEEILKEASLLKDLCDRYQVPLIINDRPDYKFEIGKGVVLKEGTDLTIVATGLCVNESLAAAAKLEEEGVHAQVINIHTIKPIDADLIAEAAKKTGKIVTVEEHSVIGGLGSAVCDVLCEREPVKVLKIGMNDVYGESGPAVKLLEKYGLDAAGIYAKIKAWL